MSPEMSATDLLARLERSEALYALLRLEPSSSRLDGSVESLDVSATDLGRALGESRLRGPGRLVGVSRTESGSSMTSMCPDPLVTVFCVVRESSDSSTIIRSEPSRADVVVL